MSVRCKMKVTAITQRTTANPTVPHESSEVELAPVYGEENKTWAKWTPGGSVKLNINNPDALEQFKIGETYFVDFTAAPATESEEK